MHEDIDSAIINYECRKCKTSLSRIKDAAYHEKKYGKCTCSYSICIKMLSSQLALKKHMNVHEEKHICISIELATNHLVQITY